MRIRPAQRVVGSLSLPGDKSISHRAALIAALADGTSYISNFSTGDDCASTISCLTKLGVSFETSKKALIVKGVGTRGLSPPREPLDCGNSGSTIRMLAGVLAGHSFRSVLTGDESLRARPMKRILEPLGLMGASVKSTNGYPPLEIVGTESLTPICYKTPVASAQVKTCILLAGLNTSGRTEVVESSVTRDHTERMLRDFGVMVATSSSSEGSISVSIEGPVRFTGRSFHVPGDFSSAAFLMAAAALLSGSELVIKGVGLNPTRTQFMSTLSSLGVPITVVEDRGGVEPSGTITVSGGQILEDKTGDEANLLDRRVVPLLIDELPLLAVVGTRVKGGLQIRDAQELRHKETDRISTTVKNLRAMGAEVEEFDDGLSVAGPQQLRGAELDSFGDHRIAMAFTVAALTAVGETQISGAECVSISFPEFFNLIESVVER